MDRPTETTAVKGLLYFGFGWARWTAGIAIGFALVALAGLLLPGNLRNLAIAPALAGFLIFMSLAAFPWAIAVFAANVYLRLTDPTRWFTWSWKGVPRLGAHPVVVAARPAHLLLRRKLLLGLGAVCCISMPILDLGFERGPGETVIMAIWSAGLALVFAPLVYVDALAYRRLLAIEPLPQCSAAHVVHPSMTRCWACREALPAGGSSPESP